MSAPYTPRAGDTVYGHDGAMAIYVSPAQGSGHIVQPLIQDGDGVTEPESYFADGVAIWPSVYPSAPLQKLDAEIAAKAEKLEALRREIAQAEQERHKSLRDQQAVRDRLKTHEALVYLDDFLNAKITHYVVEVDGQLKILDTEAFGKERSFGYSERVLSLVAAVRGGKNALDWSIKIENGYGSREISAFPDEEKARAHAHALITEKMTKAAASLRRDGYLSTAESALRNAQALGMEPLPELLAAIRDCHIKVAQQKAEAARKSLAEAEAVLANMQQVAA